MERAIDTRGAVAINVITMVGIGPLITIPLVLSALGGSLALLGWIGGAIVALCDGLVWAELASRFPSSGGTYVYLREAFGRDRLGHALAFLFNWQFLLSAPCLLATGYIGFAEYAGYLAPGLSAWLPLHLCAVGVGVVTIAVLLRKTAKVSATSLLLGAIAALTLALIALAALTHANWHMAMQLPGPVRFGGGLLAGFASALYITLYDYVGYADVALLGDEVRQPTRTIPRSIVISILLVAVLYIALQIGVLGVVPWHSLFDASGAPTVASQYVGSLVVERAWGIWAARGITLLVLLTAFASVYGNLLGFSRIPYAAARDGAFFPVFTRLHPRKRIPEVALVVVGVLSLLASLFPLDEVIAILTAGIVLIQSVMQILALFVLRMRGAAPFRMPLYPLPALIALAGWMLAFSYTGGTAIAIGIGWLVAGAAVFLVVARVQRTWPFAVAAIAAFLLLLPARPALAAPVGAWASWHTSRVTQINGYPVFEVNGKPFFVYGGAFFYERIPRGEWEEWLRVYRDELHINTIDLYVPWNWEEPTKDRLDFTGRTDPRRDVLGLFRIIHVLGLKIVLRPGPVIRNEWRNGGYPDWLLERPEYNMPLHDVLEGRYPATATLQNEHADAAANEWLHNVTHLQYAGNWLRDVLSAVAPYSHDVIAIALDDDQGAYLDNDTWPAPHWHRYVDWLKSQVESTAGRHVPVFVNTWQMKVAADSPVWAWTNWYQSDAYAIGEHDRDQIDLSADMVGTQASAPVMVSEFQAGWLQGADEDEPRPADPTNTALALSQFLADGAHGIVNFPVQDTIYPAGWEVPWANWAYDWDAALNHRFLDMWPTTSARFSPTAAFGTIVARWGPLLAATHPSVDLQIIWPPSLFRPSSPPAAAVGEDAAATIAMLRDCSDRGLTCSIIDLRYGRYALRENVALVLPIVLDADERAQLAPEIKSLLHRLRADGRLLPGLRHVTRRRLSGSPGAALLLSDEAAYGFLALANWQNYPRAFGPYVATLAGKRFVISRRVLPARGAALIPAGLSTSTPAPRASAIRIWWEQAATYLMPAHSASATVARDVAEDASVVTLQDRLVKLAFTPAAGDRATVLERNSEPAARTFISWRNFGSTIGLLRDAVDPEPTPSSRDYIAAFTHPIPGGTFNRPYRCAVARAGPPTAIVTCSYDAPDIPDGGARFERTISLANSDAEYAIEERMIPRSAASLAHLKSISGFAVNGRDVVEPGISCFGVYDPVAKGLARLCWRPEGLASYEVRETRGAAILTLHFKRNDVEMRLGVLPAASESEARSLVQKARF